MRSLIATCLLLRLINASPIIQRQAVTEAISPSAAAPSGCSPSYPDIFGIAVQNITDGSNSNQKRQWYGGHGGGYGGGKGPCNSTTVDPVITSTRRCTCEDPPAPTSTPPPRPPMTVARVSQIGDGQIQGSQHTITMYPINEISDGQIQNQRVTYAPSDYVPPSTTTPAATSGAASSATATATDGATVDSGDNTADPAASATDTASDAAATDAADDAPPADDTSSPTADDTTTPTTTASSSDTTSDSSSSSDEYDMVACRTNSSLQLHLSDGILTDALGRTGYIASNYQFQFDNPPQSESIYTAGWSVCSNGSLSLGGSSVFWQCLSGEFYNLYDRNWAAQCSPITIQVVKLVDCGSDGSGDGSDSTASDEQTPTGDEATSSDGAATDDATTSSDVAVATDDGAQ